MTMVVTGAAGFLGSHLIDALVARGERPRALIRPGETLGRLASAGADIRIGDVNDRAAIEAALAGADRVLHCAARTGPWGPDQEFQSANVDGLANVVQAATAVGVRRIVHVSSITVHGNDVRGHADEDSPLRADPNPYSRTKMAGERLVARLAVEGAAVVIVRPGWIYGPRDAASFARLARMVEAGRMIMLGSGRNHLPLIYVTDAVQGVLLASEAAAPAGRAYLLTGGEPVTQREYLAAVASELGVRPPSRHVPYQLAMAAGATAELLWRAAGAAQPPPVMRYGLQLLGGENHFSIARARAELAFSPEVSLAEGVKRSVAWYRQTAVHR